MCCGQAVQPPNEKSAFFVTVLKVLFVIQFLISISNLVTLVFLREGILGLLMITLLLFFSFYKLSYQAIIVLTFLAMFFFINFLVFVMTVVQRQTKVEGLNQYNQYIFVDACITCGYYLFLSIFMFFPYKEFKVIEFSSNPQFNQFMKNSVIGQNKNQPNEVDPYNLYGMATHPQKQNNLTSEQGTFQAFKGSGVRIG